MTDKDDVTLLGASIEAWLRDQFPKVFESWDGYQISINATETRKPELKKALTVVLVNEDTARGGGIGQMLPLAYFAIDVDTEQATLVSWNHVELNVPTKDTVKENHNAD